MTYLLLIAIIIALYLFIGSIMEAKKSANKIIPNQEENKEVIEDNPQPLFFVKKERNQTANQITFSIEPNEKEFEKRLKNNTLRINTVREVSTEDIIGFYGTENYSEDKSYVVVYNREGEVGLIYNQQKAFKLKLSITVYECYCANNGIVVVSGWEGREKPNSKVYIFDKEGTKILSKSLNVNICAINISSNGQYVVFTTYFDDKSSHSEQLFIVDTNEKKIIKQFENPALFSDLSVTDLQRIRLKQNKLIYEVDFEGNHTNQEEYKYLRFLEKPFYERLKQLEKELTPDELYKSELYLQNLLEAINDADTIQKYGKDKLCRKIGECYEIRGIKDKVIEYWEIALSLNPNIGVKKKLEILKNQ